MAVKAVSFGGAGGSGGEAVPEALADLSRKMDSQMKLLEACLQRIENLESRTGSGGSSSALSATATGSQSSGVKSLAYIAAPSKPPDMEEGVSEQAQAPDMDQQSGQSEGFPLARSATAWRTSWKAEVWRFLEDHESGWGAYLYNRLTMLLILMCVALSLSDLLHPEFPSEVVLALEVPFAAEVALRFFVCPNRHIFLFDAYNLIDVFAIVANVIPRIVVIATPFEDHSTALCIMIFSPAFWMLRLLRRFEHFSLLKHAFAEAVMVLPVLLYTLLLISLFAAGLVYLVEPRDVLPTLTDSVWYIVVTMSTVGYGDISATTVPGQLVTIAVIVCALLYTAIPIGIVGTAFSNCWEDRERLLLVQQVQRIVLRDGLTEQDLLGMFYTLDKDRSGHLSFEEFAAFLPMLRIKKKDDVVLRIFQTFDNDDSGLVSYSEFLSCAFPAQKYYYMARQLSKKKFQSEQSV